MSKEIIYKKRPLRVFYDKKKKLNYIIINNKKIYITKSDKHLKIIKYIIKHYPKIVKEKIEKEPKNKMNKIKDYLGESFKKTVNNRNNKILELLKAKEKELQFQETEHFKKYVLLDNQLKNLESLNKNNLNELEKFENKKKDYKNMIKKIVKYRNESHDQENLAKNQIQDDFFNAVLLLPEKRRAKMYNYVLAEAGFDKMDIQKFQPENILKYKKKIDKEAFKQNIDFIPFGYSLTENMKKFLKPVLKKEKWKQLRDKVYDNFEKYEYYDKEKREKQKEYNYNNPEDYFFGEENKSLYEHEEEFKEKPKLNAIANIKNKKNRWNEELHNAKPYIFAQEYGKPFNLDNQGQGNSNLQDGLYNTEIDNIMKPFKWYIRTIPFNELDNLLKSICNMNLHNLKFGIKMSPVLDISLLDKLAQVLLYHKNIVKYIVCNNTIPNGMINGMKGGISGPTNKLISISNSYYYLQKFKKEIKIFGCGGIYDHQDIKDYMDIGCDAVQLGTGLHNMLSKL
jgi:hypothetical protein